MTRIGMIELLQNDFLIILDMCLMILFARYVFYKISEEGWQWSSALYNNTTKVGWALMLTYASRWFDRIAFLFWTEGNISWARISGIISLALAVWSAACVVRVFAGTAWGPRAWMWIVGIAILFSVGIAASQWI